MRINYTTQPNDGPPNKLFEAYGPLLTLLLEPRRDTTKDTYVSVPEAETEMLAFTRAKSSTTVGLLIGPIGIGKSSILVHLYEDKWPQEGCELIVANLAKDTFAKHLGEGFSQLTPSLQRQKAAIVAIDAICGVMRTKYDPYLISHAEEVFNVIDSCAHELLPAQARWKKDPAAYPDYLIDIEGREPFKFWSCVLVQYLIATHTSHAKFVVDNIDDKNETVIAQFIEGLAHFQRHFNDVAKNHGRTDLRFTPLVACRKHTWDRMRALLDISLESTGSGWMGIRDIHIKSPCSIAAALRKRYNRDYEFLRSQGLVSNKNVVLAIGRSDKNKQWSIRQDELFGALVEMLEHTKQFDDLLGLSNYNVALAMMLLLQVLSNRYFVPVVDTYLAAVTHTVSTSAPPDELITSTTMIRALAYGNQRRECPIYPVDGTVIPNLLESAVTTFSESLLKLRIVAMLVEAESGSRHGGGAGHGRQELSSAYIKSLLVCAGGPSANDVAEVLDELYREGLLVPRQCIELPSSIGDDVVLLPLPRARILFGHLQKDTCLMECWRDSCELRSDLVWMGKPVKFVRIASQGLPIEVVGEEVMRMILQCRHVEVRELSRHGVAERREIWRRSGGFLSRRVLLGFVGSVMRHYSRYSGWDRAMHDAAITQFEDTTDKDQRDLELDDAPEDS